MSFNDPTCACEAVSKSRFGQVEDDETLARAIIAPHHLDDEGKPTPSAFDSAELMSRGFSVLRIEKVENSVLMAQAEQLAAAPGRSVAYFLVGETGAIRALRDSAGRRAFCVVDDEQPDQPNHVTVMRSADQSKIEIKELRSHLMKIFDGRLEYVATEKTEP